jgi:hypothetical protein
MLYNKHNNMTNHIENFDEIGIQAKNKSEAKVLNK